MRVCAAYGIPHSEFLSWSKTDRDKALWWDIRQRETCQSCGTRPEQLEEDPASWTWKVESCPGCELRAKGQQVATMQAKRGDPKGLKDWQYVTLIRDRKGSGAGSGPEAQD